MEERHRGEVLRAARRLGAARVRISYSLTYNTSVVACTVSVCIDLRIQCIVCKPCGLVHLW